MKFRKYVKESIEETPVLVEAAEPFVKGELDLLYAPVEKLIKEEKFEDAKKELDILAADLEQFEAENAKKKLFKMPKSFFEARRSELEKLRSQIPEGIHESLEDMDRRCEKCNTLLNDGGTCPKCDDGEEDYESKDELEEDLSVREKLKRAYPELNFDASEVVTESKVVEELSNKEKLKRAYPELNFDGTSVDAVNEKICKDDKQASENSLNETAEDDWYDDEYEIEDDVTEDRRHAALYGGDRTYCDCGAKLAHDEYGSYCPECNPQDPESVYDDEPSDIDL